LILSTSDGSLRAIFPPGLLDILWSVLLRIPDGAPRILFRLLLPLDRLNVLIVDIKLEGQLLPDGVVGNVSLAGIAVVRAAGADE
jgi:hypothetical protein